MKSYTTNDKPKRQRSYDLNMDDVSESDTKSNIKSDEDNKSKSALSYNIDIKEEKEKAKQNERIAIAQKIEEQMNEEDDYDDEDTPDVSDVSNTDDDSNFLKTKSGKIVCALIVISLMAISLIVGFMIGSVYTVTSVNKQLEEEREKDVIDADAEFYFTEISNTEAYKIGKGDSLVFKCDERNSQIENKVKIEYVIEDVSTDTMCTYKVLYGGEELSWQPSFNIADTNVTHIIQITQNVYSIDDALCTNKLGTQEIQISVSVSDDEVNQIDNTDATNPTDTNPISTDDADDTTNAVNQ